MDRISATVLWLLTRGLVLTVYFGPHSWVTGDVDYFADGLAQASSEGLAETLVEYPLAGVALVAIPWLLAQWAGQPDLYAVVVLAMALAADAAFMIVLHGFGRAGRDAAMWCWLLAVPAFGATAFARFDLVPGVLAGIAVLLLGTHARVAAGAAAVAAGLKLWPALLLPAMAARTGTRRAVVVVVALVGAVLVVASVALAGWGRLVSPLTWQVDRGLQIESVSATPAMLGWALGPGRFVVAYSDSNAYEVSGPGVPLLLAGAGPLAVLAVAGLAVMWVRAWRLGALLGPDPVVWLCLSAVSAFIVTGKVLSPQYLLWLLPMAAAGLAVVETRRGARRLRRWAAVLLATTAATHLVFPVLYAGLTTHSTHSLWVVALLGLRNVLLVWLLVSAAREAWWHLERLAAVQRGIALERHPPGPDGNDERTFR